MNGAIIPCTETNTAWSDISSGNGDCDYCIKNGVLFLKLDMQDTSGALVQIGQIPSGITLLYDIMVTAYYDKNNSNIRYRTYYVDHNTGKIYGKCENLSGSYSTVVSYPL